MKKKIKLKWLVGEAPTGRYRSFHHRSWPSAEIDGQIVFQVACEDSYTPAAARGEYPHAPLALSFTDRRPNPEVKGWVWRRLKKRFNTLAEAKREAEELLKTHPHMFGDLLK